MSNSSMEKLRKRKQQVDEVNEAKVQEVTAETIELNLTGQRKSCTFRIDPGIIPALEELASHANYHGLVVDDLIKYTGKMNNREKITVSDLVNTALVQFLSKYEAEKK